MEIKRYRNDHRDSVFELIHSIRGPEVGERLRRRWDWQFEENPFTPPSGPVILVLEDDGNVVGILCSFPVEAQVLAEKIRLFYMTDFLTAPGSRGGGILLAQAMTDLPFTFAGTPNPISCPLWIGLGCHDIGSVETCVKVIDVRAMLRKRWSQKVLTDWPGTASNALLRLWARVHRPREEKDFVVEEVSRVPDDYRSFWESCRAQYPVTTIRSDRYLKWRFLECPIRTYRILMARREGRLAGYAVIRTEVCRGLRRGYIVDFLTHVDDGEALEQILYRAETTLRRQGVATISTILPPSPERFRQVLRGRGYKIARQTRRIVGFSRAPEFPLTALRASPPWYVTLGDGELDLTE